MLHDCLAYFSQNPQIRNWCINWWELCSLAVHCFSCVFISAYFCFACQICAHAQFFGKIQTNASLLYNTSGGCFWQSHTHGTVKPAAMPVFWFRNSTCFRFWLKTSTKRCSNNYLLSRDKSIFSLHDLIGHMLLISSLVLRAGFRAGLAGLNLDYPEKPAVKPRKPS